ncbi:hypothetical protein MPSEU_000295200 [Mayamaea pseudoterrestris]|nr:hypothetical protein MPSEU_000295200 [Mayamaea pseudoterrestris]
MDEDASDLQETAEMNKANMSLLDEKGDGTLDEANDPDGVAYFSSDSEDEADKVQLPSHSSQTGQSEWDKALQTGKHSEGKAAAEFFTTPSVSLDAGDVARQASSGTSSSAGGGATAGEQFLPPVHHATQNNSKSYSSEVSVGTATADANGRKVIPSSDGTNASSNHRYPNNQHISSGSSIASSITGQQRPHPDDSDVSSGVLPDVLMTMRQKIESSFMGFDSDMMKLAAADTTIADVDDDDDEDDPMIRESRESLKRSSQQSISPAVLVSLAHKRYERRRLAAMEIEKVVRSLVQQNELGRIRAILLLLSDDYVRSLNEDARKGGVVALAACAIGLKKAKDTDPLVSECRDLILASVVHCCQCHSQRVRYYATESLFNVVKVMPSMAVQHFFILFEILRSLYADVDVDVRSGAELLDKKMKEVIVKAMIQGSEGFSAEDCIPVFARFVHMRNKATKRLTLTWLQELNEKLVSSPILEFLHLFLGGILDMVGDPSQDIRQAALAFLRSVLPKLLVNEAPGADDSTKSVGVDFDQVLQSLVTTMEHPDPCVRKVAMYWMSRIVKTHLDTPSNAPQSSENDAGAIPAVDVFKAGGHLSGAATSIRNALPNMLPGIFLSIGDDFQPNGSSKDLFLPDQSTRALAEQTNQTLQVAVRRDGPSYVPLLDGFIAALRDELDSPDGLAARHPPAVDRVPYRMDVVQDGTGIESPGWFNASKDEVTRSDESMILSRLCTLQWIIVLYESVVPVAIKAEFAGEFVIAIIHQLMDRPPETIVHKSLEVLAIITIPVEGEDSENMRTNPTPISTHPAWLSDSSDDTEAPQFPMTEQCVSYALNIIQPSHQKMFSRNREVYFALVQLHTYNEELVGDLSKLLTYMCKMQPPEFVFVSFAVEIDRFMLRGVPSTKRLKFASSFVRHLSHVLLNTNEAKPLRTTLKDCICYHTHSERDRQRSRLFHILLHTFSHNLASTLTLCFWVGAYRTSHMFINRLNPLDCNLVFFLEIDRLVEMLERPLFRHLHIRMLENDSDPTTEGSGFMLFQTLKSLLMVLPQSTCYVVLKDRLMSVSRFRQSAIAAEQLMESKKKQMVVKEDVNPFFDRVLQVRALHCAAAWDTIRAESLEVPALPVDDAMNGTGRHEWLGYSSHEAADEARETYRRDKAERRSFSVEQVSEGYDDLASIVEGNPSSPSAEGGDDDDEEIIATEPIIEPAWKDYWEQEQSTL